MSWARARTVAVSFLFIARAAASEAASRTVTVEPGSRYRAGALHGLLLSNHWRDAWTTPIDIIPRTLRERLSGNAAADTGKQA